nr:LysR family transcriptional regulator [uncultured Holophaga sp.]
MDIHQLRVFLAVAEYRSFSRAASAVFLTQSGVSYQIAALESRLGFRLFDRGTREVSLTEAGQHCRKVVQKLIAEYDRMAQRGRSIAAEGSGRIAIGIHGGCEVGWLPDWVTRLGIEHPGIQVLLSHHSIDGILPALRSREIDLGFTLFFEGERYPGMNCHPILKDPMVVAMSRSHPLAGKAHLQLAELAGQPFLYLAPPRKGVSGRGLEWRRKLCRRRGFEMDVVQTFPSFQPMFLAVESGVGLGLFGRHTLMANASPHIHQVPLMEEDCWYEHGLVWDGRNPNPNIRYFLKAAGFPGPEEGLN